MWFVILLFLRYAQTNGLMVTTTSMSLGSSVHCKAGALILVSRLSSSPGESVKDCPFATHTVRIRVGLLAKSDASPLASTARYHLPYDCMSMVSIVRFGVRVGFVKRLKWLFALLLRDFYLFDVRSITLDRERLLERIFYFCCLLIWLMICSDCICFPCEARISR